jgi:hypothetical protein
VHSAGLHPAPGLGWLSGGSVWGACMFHLHHRLQAAGLPLAEGIQHFDLPFDDCTAPPPAIIAAFLRIADAAPGAVAVHCKAGLGRTGTLVALHMMRTHGFGAREAIAWLRIMRPGSVIGEQQHALVLAESPPADLVAAAVRGPVPKCSLSRQRRTRRRRRRSWRRRCRRGATGGRCGG